MTEPRPAPAPPTPGVMLAEGPVDSQPAVSAPPPAPTPRKAAAPPVRPKPVAIAATATPKPKPTGSALPALMRLSDRVLLPDLAGLTVDQVKGVTERSDLLVEISGRGRAVAQSPPAGTIVASDALVVVRFEPGADSI